MPRLRIICTLPYSYNKLATYLLFLDKTGWLTVLIDAEGGYQKTQLPTHRLTVLCVLHNEVDVVRLLSSGHLGLSLGLE